MSTDSIDGYVLLSSYDDRSNRNQEHSTDYKRIFDAIRDGRVHGLQDGKSKRWFVNKAQADALLAEKAAPSKTAAKQKANGFVASSQIESAIGSLASIDTTLDEIYRVLERLTTAVETMATQPAAQHEYASHFAPTSNNGIHQ